MERRLEKEGKQSLPAVLVVDSVHHLHCSGPGGSRRGASVLSEQGQRSSE